MHKHDGTPDENGRAFIPVNLGCDARLHLSSEAGHSLGNVAYDNGDGLTDASALALHNALHAAAESGTDTIDVDGIDYSADGIKATVNLKDRYGRERDEARQALESFRTEVRDRVIEFQPKYDLCDEGCNRFLTALGLEPLTKTYVVEFTRRETATITVEARDKDDAREKADAFNVDWGYGDTNVEITDVWED